MIVPFQVMADIGQCWAFPAVVVVIVDDVQSRVHRQSTQEHHGGITALVEGKLEQCKGDEHTDEGERDGGNHRQRLQERLQQDGADEIDVVLNLGLFMNDELEELCEELDEIKEACHEAKLKVILEQRKFSDISL